MFNLKNSLSAFGRANEDDVLKTKTALHDLGHYDPDGKDPLAHGLNGMTDEATFEGIKSFQKANGLNVDGKMNPGGETEARINAIQQAQGQAGSAQNSARAAAAGGQTPRSGETAWQKAQRIDRERKRQAAAFQAAKGQQPAPNNRLAGAKRLTQPNPATAKGAKTKGAKGNSNQAHPKVNPDDARNLLAAALGLAATQNANQPSGARYNLLTGAALDATPEQPPAHTERHDPVAARREQRAEQRPKQPERLDPEDARLSEGLSPIKGDLFSAENGEALSGYIEVGQQIAEAGEIPPQLNADTEQLLRSKDPARQAMGRAIYYGVLYADPELAKDFSDEVRGHYNGYTEYQRSAVQNPSGDASANRVKKANNRAQNHGSTAHAGNAYLQGTATSLSKPLRGAGQLAGSESMQEWADGIDDAAARQAPVPEAYQGTDAIRRAQAAGKLTADTALAVNLAGAAKTTAGLLAQVAGKSAPRGAVAAGIEGAGGGLPGGLEAGGKAVTNALKDGVPPGAARAQGLAVAATRTAASGLLPGSRASLNGLLNRWFGKAGSSRGSLLRENVEGQIVNQIGSNVEQSLKTPSKNRRGHRRNR